MKVYINTDLEGIGGFVDWEEADIKTGRGIAYTKDILTAEVNAAIEGVLLEDGAAEIVVQDGHGGGYWGANIIAEALHPRAALIQGKRNAEITGLDHSFDLFMGIGVHSMAGTKNGVMNHTISPQIMNYRINGVLVGEIGIWAALAGYYGIPVGMVSGDYWAVEEAKALLGDVETVAVKKGLNLFTAQCMNPLEARELIRQAARSAVAGRERFKPYKVEAPAEIEIEFTRTDYAEKAERHGAERLDGRLVRFTGNDFKALFDQASI